MGKQAALDQGSAVVKEDEAEIARLLIALWSYKKWIVACTLLVTVLGGVYAFLATPVYHSQAIIALKETGRGGEASRIFSQLGGMGGMVASQLGVGNANLEKIEIMLKGSELAEVVIAENDLMPLLYPKLWDPKAKNWIPKDSTKRPTIRHGVRNLKDGRLSVAADMKKGVIKVGIRFYDPILAKQLVDFYLVALNNRIRDNVIKDAEMNREYLEKQVTNTFDPILREKILGMIGFEIEKSMLVSTQAFEILEKPVVPMFRSKPKKGLILMMSFFLGLFTSIAAIFVRNGFRSLKQTAARLEFSRGSG